MAKILEDEFSDLEMMTEESLKSLWLNKADDVWDQYLPEAKR